MAKPILTSPQEAEQAFYDAFQRADLDAMMAVWSEDDEVYCVHPGGPRLTGIERIRESWRQIFGSGATIRIQLRSEQRLRAGMLAVHCVYEQISVVGERRPANPVVATNIYLNGGGGWRMIAHHASPVAATEAPAPVDPTPTILH